jgi:hypothetical protein
MAFGHFLLGSRNFMVRALGSCVKWPLDVVMWCGHGPSSVVGSHMQPCPQPNAMSINFLFV